MVLNLMLIGLGRASWRCSVSASWLASYLAMEIYAGFRPDKSQALLARSRSWINTHTDQVIVWGGLVIGLWLIADGIYLIVT